MRIVAKTLLTSLIAILVSSSLSLAKDVTVEVTSIAAAAVSAEALSRSGGPAVDSEIEALAPKLQSLFAYNSYSFLGLVRSETEFGGSVRLELPEHFVLEVRPERFEKEGIGRIEMMVTLLKDIRTEVAGAGRGQPREEIILRTKIRLENGGTVLLGGPPISGGILVLALSARG
jgi:hypothetical protein